MRRGGSGGRIDGMNEGLRDGLVGSDGRGGILRRGQGRSGDDEGGNRSSELHFDGREIDATVAKEIRTKWGTSSDYETEEE